VCADGRMAIDTDRCRWAMDRTTLTKIDRRSMENDRGFESKPVKGSAACRWVERVDVDDRYGRMETKDPCVGSSDWVITKRVNEEEGIGFVPIEFNKEASIGSTRDVIRRIRESVPDQQQKKNAMSVHRQQWRRGGRRHRRQRSALTNERRGPLSVSRALNEQEKKMKTSSVNKPTTMR